MFSLMTATLDRSGRLVIPRKILREAGLEPGMPLEIRLQDGRIKIEPAPLAVKLVKRGRLTVAVPKETIAPLIATVVEKTRERLRPERSTKR